MATYDPGATALAQQQANDAAVNAYNNAMAQYHNDELAYQKAQEAWKETYDQATLTGYYNGQPTAATGAMMGTFGGMPTEQARENNNATALGYLGLMSKLSGPANAFNYARTLTGTPGGLADIVRAAGGAYRLPAFGGGSGEAPVPLSIDSMIRDIGQYTPGNPGGMAPTGTPGAPAPAPYAPSAPVAPAAPATPGVPPGYQRVYQMPNQQGAWSYQPSTPAPAPAQPGYIPPYGALPRGNQLSPQAMNAMTPYQQQLLMAAYGNQRDDPDAVMAQYQASLKGYGGASRGAVGF